MRLRSFLLFFLTLTIILLDFTNGARRRKHKVIKVEDYEYRDSHDYSDGIAVDAIPIKRSMDSEDVKHNRVKRHHKRI
uniref:Uncharacterized protein n=1 Tax=Acrobeloides nanus TaxID=290746 RepID=A0A914CRD7_9BILA